MFSGPGGASVGLRDLGINTIGVEIDKCASDTARANKLEVITKDVTQLNPVDFSTGSELFLQASPPCQGMSVAGKKTGHSDAQAILNALAGNAAVYNDERSHLMIEPLRWIEELNPQYIMLEQVPFVLPIFKAIASTLEKDGYEVWTDNIKFEEYGLPQTRRRAILLASKRDFKNPTPTHQYVSMSEAVGWKEDDLIGFPRKYDRGEKITIGGKDYRRRDLRWGRERSFAVTEKARSWKINAQTFITPREAAILQSFPKDYQWCGSRTAQFAQIGNALPPAMARLLGGILIA